MITQSEADVLLEMRKTFISTQAISIPEGSYQNPELLGHDNREKFKMDLRRNSYRLTKVTYQTRTRVAIILVRLDIDGSPHTNPDGAKMDGNHIHVYREGYEDKWAYPVPGDKFQNFDGIEGAFYEFCKYCNIDLSGVRFQKQL